MSSIIKVNTFQDANGNALFSSDGSGNVTTSASGLGETGPTFFAKATEGSTSFTSSTWTKVQYSQEQFDTDSCYDSSTNYRFTPTKAGYYHFDFAIDVRGTIVNHQTNLALYKNGALYTMNNIKVNELPMWVNGNTLAPANGTTDYFEIYVYSNLTSPSYEETTDGDCYFSGHWVRGL